MPHPNNVTSMQYGNNVVERMPPHSIEAEEAVLGSMMIDPEAVERVKRVLCGADFFIDRNRWVFEAMMALHDRQEPIDLVTITRELQARGQLDELGGPAYISQLMNVPTAMHAEGYARIVKRLSVRRGTLGIISDAAQAMYEEDGDEITALSEVGRRITALKYAAISRLSDEQNLMTAAEVMKTEWPVPIWIVPELLPAGLVILHGKPKSGKSWLMMQIACAKATGGRIFNKKVEPGPVLYFALEDNPRRIKDRANKQGWGHNLPVDFVLFDTFMREFGNLMEGGAERIAYLIEQRGYQLVVIDTYSKAIGMHIRSSDSNDAGAITKALAPLQSVALNQNACVTMVDHQGKGSSHEGGDPIQDLYGSIGKSGVADATLGLYRERGKLGATLSITGRDIEDQVLLLNWDKEFWMWNYEGDGTGLRMTQRRQDVLDALGKLKRAMLQTIADFVRQPKSHTHDRLNDLVSSGLVRRIEEGANVWFELIDG